MNETEKAYWAGLVDGEGCIDIKKQPTNSSRHRASPSYRLSVAVSNTKPMILLRLLEYGASISIVTHNNNRKLGNKWRTLYIAFISCAKAAEFLIEIYPYLVIKKEEAEIALAFQETVASYPRGFKLNNNELERRETLYRKLQKEKNEVQDPEDIKRMLKNAGRKNTRFWKEEEERLIIKYAPDWDKLFAMLEHRTRDSIKDRAYYLGCDTTRKGGHYAKWSKSDDESIRILVREGVDIGEIASRLCRTWWGVRNRIARLKITIPTG